MKVIVTGGSGFLGKRLCRKLIGNGHTVLSYDVLQGYDILSPEQLDRTFAEFGPHSIVHLAACSDLNIYAEKPEISYKINVIGTRNILAACEKHNVRLLFASTCCAYGNNDCHPSDETSPTCPTEPYAASKKESEADILKVGLPHCCMRLATYYGPEMRPALAPAIFLEKAHNKTPIPVHGSGVQTRTLTFVDDIVSGIVTLTESEAKFTVVNITTEEITSVLEMIQHAGRVTGNEPILEHVEDRKGQIHKEVILSSRLQSFGWKAETTFAEGMQKSYDYYTSNGNSW